MKTKAAVELRTAQAQTKAAIFDATYRSRLKLDAYLERAKKIKSDADQKDRLEARECKACFYLYRHVLVGQAFTKWTCIHCGVAQTYHNTGVPKVCPGCSEVLGLCLRCGADLELRLPSEAKKAVRPKG